MRFLLAIVLLSLVLAGCTDGVQPHPVESRSFAALDQRPLAPQEHRHSPIVDQRSIATYEPIVNGFLQNHERLLAREDIDEQIERIENVFLALGRYMELVAIYQQHVEVHGLSSAAAPRLAWAMVRIGQHEEALKQIEALRAHEPGLIPTSYFLEGALFMQRDTASARVRAVAAWEQVLELDPGFRGYESITANEMVEQIERIKLQILQDEAQGDGESHDDTFVPSQDVATVVPTEDDEADSHEIESDMESMEVEAPPASEAATDEYRILVARAEIEQAAGRVDAAEDLYLEAKRLDSARFEARFGHARLGWSAGTQRQRVTREMTSLAQRDDLTARQLWELGNFFEQSLQDEQQAKQLYQRLKDLDPAFARSVNLDARLGD